MRVVADPDTSKVDVRGHVLVVSGCGSLAYLGELSVDALISSYDLQKVAVVESPRILPLVMASAWAAPGEAGCAASVLTTAAELYQGVGAPGVSVLQVRSAIVEGGRGAFVAELWAWARAEGVAEILVVSSCASHVRVDADIDAGSDLRYVYIGSGQTPDVSSLGLGGNALALDHALSEDDLRLHTSRQVAGVFKFLRSGGIARPLLLQAAEARHDALGEGSAADGELTASDKVFDPPPRSPSAMGNASSPAVFALLGMTTEALDLRLTEQLAEATCAAVASRAGLPAAPALRKPPSWLFEMEAPTLERRLWT